MVNKKFYVVWNGRNPGIYQTWKECQLQIAGFKSARFKSFPTLEDAQAAFSAGSTHAYDEKASTVRIVPENHRPEPNSIAVDAACSGNPGKMEYRCVFTETFTELFRSKVYLMGTNNIGEFLAIVHALAWQDKEKLSLPIYSDSETAIGWVRAGKARTKMLPSAKNTELFEVIRRAEAWLKNNPIRVPIRKWDTQSWGEIPADFGRK